MTAIISNRFLCVLMLSVAVAIHDTYGECEDKRLDCYNFGQSACEAPHEQWAKNNCRKRCNLCHQDNNISTRKTPPTTPKTLTTPSSDDYHPATLRTSSPPISITTTQDPRVDNNKDNNNNDNKCWQNWVGYRQGESWKKDGGCKQRCTCEDPKQNLIGCRRIVCPTWSKLGDNCYMRPPAPGKCCPQPTCQPSTGLLFFNGYNME